MKQRRWEQIENILDQVLQLDNPKQQEKYVKNICAKDQQLCNDVIELLENIHKAKEQGFLENN